MIEITKGGEKMRRTFGALAIFALMILGAAFASPSKAEAYSGYSIDYGGGYTFYNLGNGVSGSSMNYGGGYTSYSFNNGVMGSSMNYGGGYTSYTFNTPSYSTYSYGSYGY